jgi:hypothetical protein
MQAAAHTKGGYGGVSQEVGKEFTKSDADPVEPVVEPIETLSPEDCVVIEHAIMSLLRRVMRLTAPDRDSMIKADDAGWDEGLHPRDPDGKFASSGGSAPAGYLETLGSKKPTIAGLMKHMLMTGLYSEKEIHNAANKHFEGKAQKQHVKWYQKELTVGGKNPPPMLPDPTPKQQQKLDAIGVKSGAATVEYEEEGLENFKLTPDQKTAVAALLSEAKLPPHLEAAINKFEAKNGIPAHTIKTMEMSDIFPSMKEKVATEEALTHPDPETQEALNNYAKKYGVEAAKLATEFVAQEIAELKADKEKLAAELAAKPHELSPKGKAEAKFAPKPAWDAEYYAPQVSLDASSAYQLVKTEWHTTSLSVKEKCVEKLNLIDAALNAEDGSIQDIVPFKTASSLGLAINNYLDELQNDDTKKEMAKDKEGWKPAPDVPSTPAPDQVLTDPTFKGETLHPGAKVSEIAKQHFEDKMKKYWPNTLPENLKAVQEKVGSLNQAVLEADQGETGKLAAIEPFGSGQGAAKGATDELVSQVQIDYGVKLDPQAAAKAQKEAAAQKAKAEKEQHAKLYKQFEERPHSYSDAVTKLSDAKGTKVRSRLVSDTEKIPHNGFAEVSASYLGTPTHENANYEAVGKAMQKYSDATLLQRPDDQKQALYSYKGSGYTAINDHLLAGNGIKSGSKSVIDKIKQIDAAMEDSYIPADTPVYRGMRCTLQQLTGFADPSHSIGRACELRLCLSRPQREP